MILTHSVVVIGNDFVSALVVVVAGNDIVSATIVVAVVVAGNDIMSATIVVAVNDIVSAKNRSFS